MLLFQVIAQGTVIVAQMTPSPARAQLIGGNYSA
jgi:hypothetical protein